MADAHVRRLCVRDRLPRSPRSRLHAAGPGADQARDGAAAARLLPAVPRVGDPDIPAAGRRRRLQGIRGAGQAVVRRSACGSGEDGFVESSRRRTDDDVPARGRRAPGRAASTATTRGAWSCASRGPGFIRGIQALAAGRRRCRTSRASSAGGAATERRPYDPERRRLAAGDALVRLRPVPRRVLLRAEDDAVLPLEQRAEGRADRELLRRLQVPRRPSFLRLDARRDRRRGAQGAASGVRDVEPGHPRAQRRRLRRLPHALQARRRDEGVRPLGAQPAAEHRPRLPDVPPVRRKRDRPASRRSRTARTRCSSRRRPR